MLPWRNGIEGQLDRIERGLNNQQPAPPIVQVGEDLSKYLTREEFQAREQYWRERLTEAGVKIEEVEELADKAKEAARDADEKADGALSKAKDAAIAYVQARLEGKGRLEAGKEAGAAVLVPESPETVSADDGGFRVGYRDAIFAAIAGALGYTGWRLWVAQRAAGIVMNRVEERLNGQQQPQQQP